MATSALPDLARVKEYLRVDHTAEDLTLSALLAGAVDTCGDFIGRPLVLGDGDDAEPPAVGLAVLFLVAHYFAHRTDAEAPGMPRTVESILQPHRVRGFVP